MRKELEDLKYGLTGRMNMYNENLAHHDVSSVPYLVNSLISLITEFGLPEEKKIAMMKEFEQAKKENREPDLRKAWNQPRLTEERVKEMRVLLDSFHRNGIKKQESKSNRRLTRYRGAEHLELLLSEYE